MTTPADVLKIANEEIGTRESAHDVTKYNDWYYGRRGEPWCAMFVSYCFHEAGLPLPAETPKGFAYTPYGAKWFNDNDRWAKNSETPKTGYVVFFNWPGNKENRIEHVGIVERVNKDGSIETIEGNTGPDTCCVMQRHRKVSDGIVGYGIPNYSEEDDMPSIEEVQKVVSDMYRLLARGEIDGKRSEAHYEQGQN